MVITGFLHRPNPRDFPGKRRSSSPFTAGRRSLARPGFRGRANFWINERGYALIYPNVRGSAGFGRRFMEADNQKKREDSVKDIGALLDWIHAQPDLDPTRVAVVGASYGGYMALASSVAYAPRLVAVRRFGWHLALRDAAGRHRNLPPRSRPRRVRRRTRARHAALSRRISPLSHAEKIRVPLLVSHGRNDPRVPTPRPSRSCARCAAMARRSGTCWPMTRDTVSPKVEPRLPVRCADDVSGPLPAAAELSI